MGVVGAATYEEHHGGTWDFDFGGAGALAGVGVLGLAIGVPATIGGVWLIVDGAKGSPAESVGQAPSLRWQVAPTATAFQATF